MDELDEKATPKKAPPSSARSAPLTTTFRIFAHSLDPALANALRVSLSINDLDAAIKTETLEAGLRALHKEK